MVKVTPIFKKGLKKDPGDYRPISLTSVPGKVMEWILLGAITSQMKHMVGKSQHRFTTGKLCLTNLIAFYSKITCLVVVGWALDIVYLDFSEAFDSFPQPPPREADVLQSGQAMGIISPGKRWVPQHWTLLRFGSTGQRATLPRPGFCQERLDQMNLEVPPNQIFCDTQLIHFGCCVW